MAMGIKYGIAGLAGLAVIKGVSVFSGAAGDQVDGPERLFQAQAQEAQTVMEEPATPGPADAGDILSGPDGGEGSNPAPMPEPATRGTVPAAEGTIDLPEILAAIEMERTALRKRSSELDTREATINMARDAVLEQTRHLEALQAELEAQLSRSERQHTSDVAKLIDIYKAMKPAQAAAILNDADIEVAVLVLAEMDARSSGPIIAVMDKVRASAISRIMLERSRLPGDQKLTGIRIK